MDTKWTEGGCVRGLGSTFHTKLALVCTDFVLTGQESDEVSDEEESMALDSSIDAKKG